MRPVRWRFPSSFHVLVLIGLAGLATPALAQTGSAVIGGSTPKALSGSSTTLAQEKARGRKFLKKMARQKGAVRLKGGMVFISTKEGTGPTPKPDSVVRVDQVAATIDGKVFDESPIGKPIEIDLSKVIPCWREGVPRIKVGGKARLGCPPELAFGDRGAPDHFPSGATIIYDIEVIALVK
jgi:FKBP-type peptidyl-prolyl cis-trans isomerase FkpA